MQNLTPPPSDRTQVRRLPARGAYDRETVHAILDAAFLCHVGFAGADGCPVVIPTAYGRNDETLYLHGSAASHMLRTLAGATVEACVTVTLLDGLVLARSMFHHSMNYRSVMIFGRARVLETEGAKMDALETISDQILKGRWQAARLPTAQELKATKVLALPLAEASAKIRTGPPKDEADDYTLPIWAGVVPVTTVYGAPVVDPALPSGIPLPTHVKNLGARVAR
ncbi:MAG TPA: pyridoxamine 5'-phosphate oxidase family protein [Terriglobales bacterium]|nr:pyridoxamine 5'-phosphate oxidase family protein [Terriglobales bacterium]